MLRPGIRLVILDEPFSGLDREQRKELLSRVRRLWRGTTMLCITHDVSEAEGFGHVMVIEGGHVVEQGAPAELLRRPHSRYRELLEAEEAVWKRVWSSCEWRRVWLKHGRVVEKDKGAVGAA
jgi:ATP-binding cassette subfamily B protein